MSAVAGYLPATLDCDDLDILMDSLNAAQSKLRREHPEEREFWHELMDIQDDLHKAWNLAFLRKQLATPSPGRRMKP
jgi:hypothetical protein